VRKKIRNLEGKLKYLRLSNENCSEARLVEKELCELFEREEIMARQRSRVDWLCEGDRNTAFFHAKATARKRANRITRLIKEDGSICTDSTEIKGMVQLFYDHLFTSESCPATDDVLEAIPQKVTSEMNENLCRRLRQPYFRWVQLKRQGRTVSLLYFIKPTGSFSIRRYVLRFGVFLRVVLSLKVFVIRL
jgi:hypothetical protein